MEILNAWVAELSGNIEAYVVAAVAAFSVAMIVFFGLDQLAGRRESAPASVSSSQDAEVERSFRNVFSVMTEDRRLSLLWYYMQKHECDRWSAMRLAIEDRQRESNRW